jgi:membrane protein
MRRAFTILMDAYLRFVQDDGWAIASHIALTGLTSLFPFLIFFTALAGSLGTKELADEATRILLEAWPEKVAAPIITEIHNVLEQPHGGLLTFGGGLALYFASNAVEALRIGLNRAYDRSETRSWWLLRLESIGYILLGALALLTLAFGVVLAPLLYAKVERYLPDFAPLHGTFTVSRLAVATVVLMVTLVVIHKFLPAGRRSLNMIAPGVAFTFVTSLMAGEIFGAYLARFSSNYFSTYAGLASVMIALVFLYTIAAIFLFGGHLNMALAQAGKREKGNEPQR